MEWMFSFLAIWYLLFTRHAGLDDQIQDFVNGRAHAEPSRHAHALDYCWPQGLREKKNIDN